MTLQKNRTEVRRMSEKQKAKFAAKGITNPKTTLLPKAGAKPWLMCRTCHRKGGDRECRHELRGAGVCGQCGERRPLVQCHRYDFRKAIPKENTERRRRRRSKNDAYYKSAEWRAKKKATHIRDGYQCTEIIHVPYLASAPTETPCSYRCPNRGEVVNGKQTAKGLVCEEVSYGHRGVPDRIDTCRTRCRSCDRRQTPLERINHAHGFRGGRS